METYKLKLMNKKRIYVDMDGVLCDYDTQLANAKLSTGIEFPQNQYGFFSEIKPMPHFELVRYLAKYFDVWILTRPSLKNLLCYTEKAFWVKKHLGDEFLRKLILCTDKSLVKGDYLIDDQVGFGQEEFEGELIKFGVDFKDWVEVTKYIMKKEENIEYILELKDNTIRLL